MQALLDFSKEFNTHLPSFFAKPNGKEKKVIEAMEYAVMNGGKRLRPFLLFQTASLFNKTFDDILPTAAALEMLHTYSLIHDDLPAMDNDNLRRGKPTCHIAFDEATAILAGDGLLTYCFELMANQDLSNDIKIKLIAMLSNAAGAFNGMIAGQSLDLQASSPEDIKNIEVMKTGRLIRYAIEAGAIIGNATQQEQNALISYGTKIGQAFQVSDDILDIIGNQEKMGKTLKKDIDQNKITFVSLYGLEKAQQIAAELINSAIEDIAFFGPKAKNLIDLANFIINREN